MKRYSYLGPMLAIPVVIAIVTLIPGCPNKEKKDGAAKGGDGPKEVKVGGDLGKGGGKTEPFVVANSDGVIKGKIEYDGTPPAPAEIAKMKEHADSAKCLAGPHVDTTWIVSKSGGVENVVVFVEPPKGKFFALDKTAAEKYKGDAAIDQPFCVYEPRIVALYAQYRDKDGKLGEEIQKLAIKNSGGISHNTKIIGDPKVGNPENFSKNIDPETKKGVELPLKYQKKPLDVVCDKHNWMQAKILTFDNPYFAVTDKDGNFEIKNVPAGSKLTIKTWHEQGAPQTKELDVKAGTNDAGTLKIKAAS